uniref:Uncharacterized protein n=1 Tax=Anguilla anguilla TaxID=7936 RepID=A0A0E9RFR3_ANGAN
MPIGASDYFQKVTEHI